MSFTVEFPGLGFTLNVPRVAFTVFGIDVYWYGVIIVTGLFLAVLYAYTQCGRFGVDRERMIDVVMVGLVCAIIGGRLYYIVDSSLSITQFFDFRGGGIGIYGAIIGAFAGAAVMCKIRKVPVLPLFDMAGIGFLIGQSIGVGGNFFNQEAFGTNTTLPWGMYSNGTYSFLSYRQAALAEQGIMVNPSLPVHPTFLYESLWCALGLLLLHLYRKRRRFNGELVLFYAIWYGLGRFFIEGLRTDSLLLPGTEIRVSQVVAAVSVIAGIAVWAIARNKTKGQPLRVPEVPPRTAKVSVLTARGEQQVTISWPANGKEPTREQREQMARLVLEEEGEPSGEPDTAEAEREKPSEALEDALDQVAEGTSAELGLDAPEGIEDTEDIEEETGEE